MYGLEKPQYRVFETENNAGKKFYFLQRCIYGFHYYERKWYSFWKKSLHHSELEWVYLFNDDKKGQYSNEYFDCIMTKDIWGKNVPVNLQLHLDKACKSKEEAVQLMHEHIGWIEFLQRKKKEAEKEEEDNKLNPKKTNIIPLYDLDGKIMSTYDNMKKETIYDDKTK